MKQVVRGIEKWYVDFGCANLRICIEVCSWSEPGDGPWLSQRLLDKRREW